MATIKSFKALRAAGGVVSKEPIKRHIEWKTVDPVSGEEMDYDADVWVVKQGAGSMLDVISDTSKEQISVILSKSIMLEDDKGKLVLMSFDDAYQLDPPLRQVLWDECQKVAGLVRKNSVPTTSSSAISPSTESVETPSLPSDKT